MTEFVPTHKNWNIGGVEYVQTPLGLDRLGQLFGLIGKTFGELQEKGLIEKVANIDLNKSSDAMSLAGILLTQTPNLVVELFAIALDISTVKDLENIKKNLNIRNMIQLATEFVNQNDVRGIKEDFLELQTVLSTQLSPSDQSTNQE